MDDGDNKGVMGDAVAIGDFACITSCVGGEGENSDVCLREREREKWSGKGEERIGKEEGIKEEGREYQ